MGIGRVLYSRPAAIRRSRPGERSDREVRAADGGVQVHAALGAVVDFATACNTYIEMTAPWKLAKDPERTETLDHVLYGLAESLRIIAILVAPVLPKASREILEAAELEGRGDDGGDRLGRFTRRPPRSVNHRRFFRASRRMRRSGLMTDLCRAPPSSALDRGARFRYTRLGVLRRLRAKFPTEEEVRGKLHDGMTCRARFWRSSASLPGHQWVDVKLGGKVHYIAPICGADEARGRVCRLHHLLRSGEGVGLGGDPDESRPTNIAWLPAPEQRLGVGGAGAFVCAGAGLAFAATAGKAQRLRRGTAELLAGLRCARNPERGSARRIFASSPTRRLCRLSSTKRARIRA